MARQLRHATAPVYLLLCLLLGGSAQGIWVNMILQLLGIAILAWAALAPAKEPLLPPARQLLLLALIAIAVVGLQLIPLPASVWRHLGGRAAFGKDYQVLGIPTPAMPISLNPYGSLSALFCLIPPLAMFCAIVRLRAYRSTWLAVALLAGTVAGILLGALQVASGDARSSPWYLYEESNFYVATGFFANANHMAILLVVALPFLAAVVSSARSANKQRNSAIYAVVAGLVIVILVGIALNRSLAAYGLALPVLLMSSLLVLPPKSRWRMLALPAAGLLLVGALVVIATSSTRPGEFGQEANTSVQSREDMFKTTTRAIGDFMPFGSGLSSFRGVYQLYESRDQITTTYVIHAHDDYLELVLELGVAGILLILAFLAWWAVAVWRAWRSSEAGAYARAASIASAAILCHSLVDFPLRTAAISAVFAMCLGLLVERRKRVLRDSSDLRPTRHVVLK